MNNNILDNTFFSRREDHLCHKDGEKKRTDLVSKGWREDEDSMIPEGWKNKSKRTINYEDSPVSRKKEKNGVLDIKRGRGERN